MKRRDFLKNITAGSIILNVNPGIFAQAKKFPDLAVVEGESPSKITREALKTIGGLSRFVSKGDEVLVKPNIGWDRTPEQAACTNPEVIKTLVELCFEAGAKKVKVMDHPTNPARRTYVRSGIAEAAKQAGADVPFPNEHKLTKVPIHGEKLKEWEVYRDFLETDKLINVPITKHHSLSRLTLGMKNWLGALGGNRNQLHQSLDYVMVDLAAFFKPVLSFLDAYRVLYRNGPQGGRLSDVKLLKTVVAGVDYVAVDRMGVQFMDQFIDANPEEIMYLKIAHERGLGEIDLEKLNIEKRKV